MGMEITTSQPGVIKKGERIDFSEKFCNKTSFCLVHCKHLNTTTPLILFTIQFNGKEIAIGRDGERF